MRRASCVGRESVSVYSGLCNKNVISWTVYKQPTVVSHRLEAGSFRMVLPAESVSARARCLIEEGVSGSFTMARIPLIMAKPKRLHLLMASPWALHFRWEFGGMQTPSLCQTESCSYADVPVEYAWNLRVRGPGRMFKMGLFKQF